MGRIPVHVSANERSFQTRELKPGDTLTNWICKRARILITCNILDIVRYVILVVYQKKINHPLNSSG